MAKPKRSTQTEAEKLTRKIKFLQQELLDATESLRSIEPNGIDALVISGKKDIRVFTDSSSDKVYRILIEKMHEGAVTINEGGTIMYCNSHFASMVKLPLQKVIGSSFATFIQNPLSDEGAVVSNQPSAGPSKREAFIYPAKGTPIPVLLSMTALSLDDNLMLSIILTDLTVQNKNRKELLQKTIELEVKNAELETANKDLISFTYVSSHDLQEPLRKIQNFISIILAEESSNLSEKGHDYLKRSYETALRMRILINDLLTYAGAKNSDHKFELTNLGTIVTQVMKDLSDSILEKNAIINFDELGNFNLIRYQFTQLMSNLISNSLKFSRPQTLPRIKISSNIVKGSSLMSKKTRAIEGGLPAGSLSSKINYHHIIYRDNGIGFDKQYKDKIFEVFQRLHAHEKYKGTGIGLAICKRIVENHHGIITGTGRVNEGARFDIYVPV